MSNELKFRNFYRLSYFFLTKKLPLASNLFYISHHFIGQVKNRLRAATFGISATLNTDPTYSANKNKFRLKKVIFVSRTTHYSAIITVHQCNTNQINALSRNFSQI